MSRNTLEGTPTTREPSVTREDELVTWRGLNKRIEVVYKWQIISKEKKNPKKFAHRLYFSFIHEGTSYLENPWRQQRLDDEPGLSFAPAQHTGQNAQGVPQVLRRYHPELTHGYAGALVTEGRNGRSVDVVTEITCQSSRDLKHIRSEDDQLLNRYKITAFLQQNLRRL